MALTNDFFAGRTMVTGPDAAKVLGVHLNTLNKWINRGVGVPFHQVPGLGRLYDTAELLKWKEAVEQYKPPPPIRTASQERAEQRAQVAELIAKTDKLLAELAAREAV